MKFRIERNFLTDEMGRTLAPGAETTWHMVDGETIDEVVRAVADLEKAELVGSILRFAGLQAVATFRAGRRVFTVQIDPATERYAVRRSDSQSEGPARR